MPIIIILILTTQNSQISGFSFFSEFDLFQPRNYSSVKTALNGYSTDDIIKWLLDRRQHEMVNRHNKALNGYSTDDSIKWLLDRRQH